MSLTPPGPGPFVLRRWRIRFIFVAVLIALAVGVVAFRTLEGWSILDSLYVTVQTVTTVVYGDLTPQTTAGRAFASVFMLFGVGLVLYALTSAVQSIVQSELL